MLDLCGCHVSQTARSIYVTVTVVLMLLTKRLYFRTNLCAMWVIVCVAYVGCDSLLGFIICNLYGSFCLIALM